MELRDHLVILFLLLGIAEICICLTSKVKPLVKVIRGLEDLWKKEVEQTPKLVKVVLEWSSCEQEPVFGVKLANSLASLTVFVFDLVGFVNYNIFPIKLLQWTHAEAYTLKSRDADIEFTWLETGFDNLFSLLFPCD